MDGLHYGLRTRFHATRDLAPAFPFKIQDDLKAQIASLLFIALESNTLAYLGCGDFPYIH
jgi:hypothetical protein